MRSEGGALKKPTRAKAGLVVAKTKAAAPSRRLLGDIRRLIGSARERIARFVKKLQQAVQLARRRIPETTGAEG